MGKKGMSAGDKLEVRGSVHASIYLIITFIEPQDCARDLSLLVSSHAGFPSALTMRLWIALDIQNHFCVALWVVGKAWHAR